MKEQPIVPRKLIECLFAALVASLAVAGAQEEQPKALPSGGTETIDVELRQVPFYAVDGKGHPVFDLKAGEVELRLGERTIPIESFDHYPTAGAETIRTLAQAPAPAPPGTEPRHVFLLFDQVFSNPRGLMKGRELAEKLLERLPESDYLYLLTYHSQTGFRQILGPLRADAEGRARMIEGIDDLRHNVERVLLNTTFLNDGEARGSLPPIVMGRQDGDGGRAGVGGRQLPAEQAHNMYEAAAAIERSVYREAANDLASGLETLAAGLGQLKGAKLLVFLSDGIKRDLYFEGNWGYQIGTNSQAYHGKNWRYGPIMYRFEEALRTLARSGTVPVFLQLDESVKVGRDSLAHWSESAGGLFLENGTSEYLAARIADSTSAYYEAGFYTRENYDFDTPELAVVIHRKDVRAIYPKRLRQRRGFETLDATQREFLIVDFVRGGIAGESLAALHQLEGQLASRKSRRSLVFQADWPESARGKKLELYDVALELVDGKDPKMLRFERKGVAAEDPVRLETALPRDGVYVWGIVAVEPSTGDTFYRRLKLEARGEAIEITQ